MKFVSQWFTQVYSVHLLVILVLLSANVFYLAMNAEKMPARRFIGLSILAGLLFVLVIATGFRTPTIAHLLKLPAGSMVEKSLSWIKAMIALTAAALSVYEGGLILEKKPLKKYWTKGIALGLAVMAIGAYFRYGDLGYSNYYHRWEFFHYYLGSKYDRELGYEGLYKCTAVAQADSGPQQANEVRARKLRDLSIDVLAPAETVLQHPEECRDKFTTERWEAFKADVKFFRGTSSLSYWNDMQKDHGYNPPPVWTVMGHFWASQRPATDGFIKFLAAFDPLFFIGIFASLYWAFGWRVFCVAAIVWGCQQPAEYFWTGGAFMRQDWLFWLVLSACLVRKRYFALGGAAFAYSTLLRVFPGVLLVGWAVVAGAHLWKHKRMAPSHLRVMLGGLSATILLVGISASVAGWKSYPEFYKHIQVHNRTPLTNNMGFETLLSQSYAGRMEFVRDEKLLDPFGPWKQMRRDRLKAFRPLHLVMLLGLGIAFVAVVRRIKSLWIAQALSLAIVVSIVEVTCYYYSMFILAAVLSRMRRGVEQWVLCLTGISQLLVINRYLSYFYDDRYTTQSALFCLFAFSLLAAYWRKSKKIETTPALVGETLAAAATGRPSQPAPQA